MPLWKCDECHHEWEGSRPTCDWCKANGHILEKETPFEKMVKEYFGKKDK